MLFRSSTIARPRFATDALDRVSGRSARRARYAAALYDVQLTYDLLRADAAHGELQSIAGFFGAMLGQDAPFWIAPPGLAEVGGQALGTGDGATAAFPLVRTFGSYSEPVTGASDVRAVYFDGVTVSPSLYSATPGYGPAIAFATAPVAGVAISADFDLLWLCRFADDVLDFEEFMAMLFTLGVVKLQTVRP